MKFNFIQSWILPEAWITTDFPGQNSGLLTKHLIDW